MPGFNLTLIQKIVLTDQVYLFTFLTDTPASYKPGQFVSLETLPQVYRAYSIAYLGPQLPFFVENLPQIDGEKNNYLSLIVSTKPGGLASGYFETVTIGTQMRALNISGRFTVRNTSLNKCFVCTGTGLAPFIPMIQKTLSTQPQTKIKLFFGAFKRGQDFSRRFFSSEMLANPNLKIISCIDNEEFAEDQNSRMGRVTEIVPHEITDLINTEFYLCGNPFMIQAMEQKLQAQGVTKEHIFKEAFGNLRQVK